MAFVAISLATLSVVACEPSTPSLPPCAEEDASSGPIPCVWDDGSGHRLVITCDTDWVWSHPNGVEHCAK